MIMIEGNLTNKVIHGARGDFSSGTLICPEGQFKIKSALLDEYDEGEYQAKAGVIKFSLNSYLAKRTGVIITEIVAEITALELTDPVIKAVDNEIIEPDASVGETIQQPESIVTPELSPVVKTDDRQDSPTLSPPVKIKKTADGMTGDEDLTSNPEKLFGCLWPLPEIVKLDSTIKRTVFIQQKQYLSSNGFQFNFKEQTWSLAA